VCHREPSFAASRCPFVSPSWIEKFSDWPATETTVTNLYLTADHQLIRARPSSGGESGELKYFYPYSTEIVATNETFSMPPMSLGSVIYRTPPTTEDTMILGVPNLTLYPGSPVGAGAARDPSPDGQGAGADLRRPAAAAVPQGARARPVAGALREHVLRKDAPICIGRRREPWI
jgi:hypothetical protein